MSTERTYVMIKPDGVQRGLVGEIIARFERKGFKLVGLKSVNGKLVYTLTRLGPWLHADSTEMSGLCLWRV